MYRHSDGLSGQLGVASRVPLMMYVQTPVALFMGVVFLQESSHSLRLNRCCYNPFFWCMDDSLPVFSYKALKSLIYNKKALLFGT